MTVSETGVPVSVPSKGVAVQTTVSPAVVRAAARVAALPAALPLTVQAKVDWSLSPSASEKPLALQTSGSSVAGWAGEMVAAARVGAVLSTVRASSRGVPVELPS